ncbi:coiled-coil domain-containing protein 50 isoform X1 [Esox lucius]|uniref:Coiled-coil domain-containing protein n=1 Tax=Esox lucius TaxID=8010 RepID=A0A3P8YCX7_ESOLU|nr:coiled-coil domain-containing protein 50 isoform X1 [Esox lucius]
MAEFSIDQNKLPGVKEVVRDFAVLEDHCLAHNLQEQEIESHLASNITKSRLVQQDVALAKQLQQEEDRRAKAKAHRQQRDIERSDNEIAQEIQEELVRQAEQQRIQEEKDAAIARKLQEKEMKEERKRQKQLEANFEEEYYEDKGAARPPLDLHEKPRRPAPRPYSPLLEPLTLGSRRGHSPEYSSPERGARSEYCVERRANHGDCYPDNHPPTEGRSRGKGGQRSRETQGLDIQEHRRHRDDRGEEADRTVRKKEGPPRPPPPSHMPVERDKTWERDRLRENRRDLEEMDTQRPSEPSRDRQHNRHQRRERTRSRELDLDEDLEPFQASRSRPGPGGGERGPGHAEVEEEEQSNAHLRLHSVPSELWEEQARRSPGRERGERRAHRDPGEGPSTGRVRSHSHPTPREQGRIVQGGPGGRGPVLAGGEYGLGEATQGITKLDLREQELLDMEVARKLQEEEMKASKMDKRAAQVAQDEEIARLLMEQEKKEYKRSRDKEKQAMRPEERRRPEERGMKPEERGLRTEERRRPEERVMRLEERRRPEGGDYKPISEEVVRPRLREEEYQKPRNPQKPTRPPQPHPQIYENVDSTYSYSETHYMSRTPARPEASYKGASYRQ